MRLAKAFGLITSYFFQRRLSARSSPLFSFLDYGFRQFLWANHAGMVCVKGRKLKEVAQQDTDANTVYIPVVINHTFPVA
jgi:hypothetical protein